MLDPDMLLLAAGGVAIVLSFVEIAATVARRRARMEG